MHFTIKWVNFINVLWYKEARSVKDFCHKISKTIISEFSNSNAKQKQTGNWNYGYDLHLTVYLLFLNTILKSSDVGVSKLFRRIFLKKENTTQKRQNNLNDICDMAKVRYLRDFYKTVKKNNGKSHDNVHLFYPLDMVVLIKQKYLSLETR